MSGEEECLVTSGLGLGNLAYDGCRRDRFGGMINDESSIY